MRYNRSILFALVFSLFLFACSKNGSSGGGGNPVNTSYLASARTYAPGTLLIDSFSYDASHNVAWFAQYAFDNTTGTALSDTITMTFSFSGSNPLPQSYTYTTGGSSELHRLTFDGQNRIIKDTGVNGSGFVTYYTYTGNYVIEKILFDGSTTDNAFIDTLVVTGGNMTAEKVWGVDQGTWDKQADLVYGHSSAANPGYKEEIASTVGPLLCVLSVYNYGGWGDYISKGVVNKVSGAADGLPGTGVNYAVSTDGSGRVSAVTPAGAPAGTKVVFTYYP